MTAHLRVVSRRPRTRVVIFGLCGLLGVGLLTGAAAAGVFNIAVSATTPHSADGLDKSSIAATVTDASAAPVTNAELAFEISDTHPLVSQVGHFNASLIANHAGRGTYPALLASPDVGFMRIVAQDRGGPLNAFATVEFQGPLPVAFVLAAAPAADPVENCKGFFDKLDEEFLVTVLAGRIDAATQQQNDAELQRLRRRLADIMAITAPTQTAMALEIAMARGDKARVAELTKSLATASANSRAALTRISDAQEAIFKEFFGDPVDFNKLQTCVESFTNFQLADNFDDTVDRIRRARVLFDQITELRAMIGKTPPGDERNKLIQELERLGQQFFRDFRRIAVRAPDGTQENIRWAKFANIAITQNISASLWRTLKPILAKGSTITVEVLKKRNPDRPGVPNGKLTDAEIARIRAVFDPLRPRDGDTAKERDQKIAQVEARLVDLLKRIKVDRATIAQLPGLDGTSTIATRVTSATCLEGDESALEAESTSALALTLEGESPFGFGVDRTGASYLATGSAVGSEFRLALSGFGLAPVIGSGVSTLTGTIIGDTVSGDWSGVGASTPGRPNNICLWSGTFTIAPRLRCDINGDGQVDRDDMNVIFRARNVPTTSGDPRDPDVDGLITVNDSRVCTLECSNLQCANLALDIDVPRRIATGFATSALACTRTPAATLACQLDNRAEDGGALVECQTTGTAAVTVRFLDTDGVQRTLTQTVYCR